MASEHQKQIGEFLVVWKNEEGREPELHILHDHANEKEKNLWKLCLAEPESDTWLCRKCDKKVPGGVLYFGKTRRLSEEQ